MFYMRQTETHQSFQRPKAKEWYWPQMPSLQTSEEGKENYPEKASGEEKGPSCNTRVKGPGEEKGHLGHGRSGQIRDGTPG